MEKKWSDRKGWFMTIVSGLIVAGVVGVVSMGFEKKSSDASGNITPKPCRDISHGIERYSHSELVEQNSGWIGGGRTQGWWCQEMKNRYQATKPNTPIIWGEVTSSEERRKTVLGRAEYNYHCSVQASWDPIYKEKISSACY